MNKMKTLLCNANKFRSSGDANKYYSLFLIKIVWSPLVFFSFYFDFFFFWFAYVDKNMKKGDQLYNASADK